MARCADDRARVYSVVPRLAERCNRRLKSRRLLLWIGPRECTLSQSELAHCRELGCQQRRVLRLETQAVVCGRGRAVTYDKRTFSG
jgi:hypothetical protein